MLSRIYPAIRYGNFPEVQNHDGSNQKATNEAAEFLGVAPGTLVVWRSTKRYDLPYFKVGGSVRYDLDDLIAFLEERRISRRQREM